jgi:hypothetical protein
MRLIRSFNTTRTSLRVKLQKCDNNNNMKCELSSTGRGQCLDGWSPGKLDFSIACNP